MSVSQVDTLPDIQKKNQALIKIYSKINVMIISGIFTKHNK